MHARAEGQVGQDRQLLGRIRAVDVHGRVHLGVAQSLGFLDGVGVGNVFLFHLGEDEVAGAVENGRDRFDLVGRQALADVGDDRNAAGHRSLEGDRPAQFASPIEQLRPMLGQQGLVGRDHVLAAFQQLEHDGTGRLQPALQMAHGHDVADCAVIRLRSSDKNARGQFAAARLVQIAHDDFFQPERAAGMAQVRSP